MRYSSCQKLILLLRFFTILVTYFFLYFYFLPSNWVILQFQSACFGNITIMTLHVKPTISNLPKYWSVLKKYQHLYVFHIFNPFNYLKYFLCFKLK